MGARGYYESSRAVFAISEARMKHAGPYSNHLRWEMIFYRVFYLRTYQEIASQLFFSTKTVCRTYQTFINTGDVKLCVLGRPNDNYM